MDDLSARGLMPSAVLKLLDTLPPDRLNSIPNYIDYFDQAQKGGDVGPGLLFDLIRNGDPLPASFETRWQKAERIAAEDRKENLGRIQEELKAEYESFTRQAIDGYIAEELPTGEFDRRVAAHMAEPANQSDFWKERPDVAEQFARHAVRAEISKGISLLAYEDFSPRELPRIAAKLQLDPAQSLPTTSDGAASTPKNALYAPSASVPPQNEVPHTSE